MSFRRSSITWREHLTDYKNGSSNIRMDVTEETRGDLNMGCVSRFGGSGRFVAIEQGVSSERHSGVRCDTKSLVLL